MRELPWTQHLIILGQSKRPEEREFYLRRCIEERWSSRELERQFRRAVFERTVLNSPKVSPAVTQIHPAAAGIFKDAYVVEFLQLPKGHTEAEEEGRPAMIADLQWEGVGLQLCIVNA